MPDLVANAIALFLAWMFGVAAVHKFGHAGHYRRLVGSYLDTASVPAGAVYTIAALELTLALALLIPGVAGAVGLPGAAALLVAYAGLMGLQLARGRADMKCGCAGPAADVTISPALVVRNLVCAALALAATMPALEVSVGMTGILFSLLLAIFAIVVYLNQYPIQPRERDYAYAASFYAFAIWIGIGVAGLIEWASKRKRSVVTKSCDEIPAV